MYFLSGIFLLLARERDLTLYQLLNIGFFFVFSHTIAGIIKLNEDDIRKGKFEMLLYENPTYHRFCLVRITVSFILNVLMYLLLAVLIITLFRLHIVFQLIPFINLFFYLLMVLINTLVYSLIFVVSVLRFKRIRAAFGIINFTVLFYSGIVFEVPWYFTLNTLYETSILLNTIHAKNILTLFIILLTMFFLTIHLLNRWIHQMKLKGATAHV